MNNYTSNHKLSVEELQIIKGGYSNKQRLKGIGGWTASGAVYGAVSGLGAGGVIGGCAISATANLWSQW